MGIARQVVALCTLAAVQNAFANVTTDNVAWSVKHAGAASSEPQCAAYSQRPIAKISDKESGPTDPTAAGLKVLGTLAAMSALSIVAHDSGPGRNPCKAGF
ncbi:hypothetical protein [Paraburkholderia terrae]|uniref:Uncharacterized protein n=1 Tax=Paraburkholderia terrae TaxID=311230 RepID=A0A2I8EP90_9BURK|nr:hypothetical protein [Paraburkholderia terrae]AUT61212.1 hypothetical protein C2L65_12050 [Paraburkholderia terrae]